MARPLKTRVLGSILGLLLGVATPCQAQEFSWFATTMSMGQAANEHASVIVLPETSWVAGDSVATLSSDAMRARDVARDRGVRVIAAAPANGSQALDLLWDGLLDGLIVTPGLLGSEVLRPESAVVLSAGSADASLDGRLTSLTVDPGDWEALDSVNVSRAPSMAAPNPAHEIVRLNADSPSAAVFLPGSVLLPEDTPSAWAKALAFRSAHPAIAGGVHARLDGEAYAFYRGLKLARDEVDEVVVVLGASGPTRINVSTAFENDSVVREVISGQIALVSYGQLMFDVGPSGMLLIEVVK